MIVEHMMRWRPSAPFLLFSKRFKIRLHIHSFEGLPAMLPETEGKEDAESMVMMMVEVKWMGSKGSLGCHFVRSHKVSRTTHKKRDPGCDAIVWDEVFEHTCPLHTNTTGSGFFPFHVRFSIFQVGSRTKATIVGSSVIDVGEFADLSQQISQHTAKLQIHPPEGSADSAATLVVAIGLSEVGQSVPHSLQCLSGPLICDQRIGEICRKKIGKMKRSLSVNWRKASGELDPMVGKGGNSPGSVLDVGDLVDPDTLEISDEDNICEEVDRAVQNYSHLSTINLIVDVVMCNDKGIESSDVELLHQKVLDGGCEDDDDDDGDDTPKSQSDESMTMWNFLSWGRKHKSGFRSPQKRGKPLLNKAYGEDGGDDIDYDRRLSHHPVDAYITLQQKGHKEVSSSVTTRDTVDFGDEHFSIGSWEKIDIVSRDGRMKLSTNVFFASIDQRNERADGESACTTLVAVITDWLHRNPNRMPIKAEFDTLIREGSAEWRKLCDADDYRDRFPDRHFDLETVIRAKIRDVTVSHDHSFIGFFNLNEGDGTCNYLQGAMTIDDIWEAIDKVSVKNDGNFEPAIYIVSWNDHFFVFKVEKDAYYIIDTLGERLYEGCTQAYILRFDMETALTDMPNPDKQDSQICDTSTTDVEPTLFKAETPSLEQLPNGTCSPTNQEELERDQLDIGIKEEKSVKLEYCARDACKQFLMCFFAAVPLRELEVDIKKGLVKEIPLQKLQIEFHYTSMT